MKNKTEDNKNHEKINDEQVKLHLILTTVEKHKLGHKKKKNKILITVFVVLFLIFTILSIVRIELLIFLLIIAFSLIYVYSNDEN